ncbi:hypothetical protein EW146_g9483 [Bondarzewia mesenterica]|uniref:Uncharacterized protein n=1 Tax=Bondarzewia mesenterica TaxID=1095465 RepID=A0A4S4L7C1_9AGAM|nr:hypothetical protein EW146_g9483 [Bondarzewia mesenterica]
MNGSEDDLVQIAELITPRSQSLNPPLVRNIKSDRGFHHDRTGALLCPTGMDWSSGEIKEQLHNGEVVIAGDQWLIVLYSGEAYDPEDPWNGLFRGTLLIAAYKHIFTSPSSVDKELRATHAGNARIHGMTRVTPASIAYIATQVRFALTSSPIFSRTDIVTDSEHFYTSILELFEDIEEQEEVSALIVWWNRQIFPSYSTAQRPVSKNSALARIKEKRAVMRAAVVAAAAGGRRGGNTMPGDDESNAGAAGIRAM